MTREEIMENMYKEWAEAENTLKEKAWKELPVEWRQTLNKCTNVQFDKVNDTARWTVPVIGKGKQAIVVMLHGDGDFSASHINDDWTRTSRPIDFLEAKRLAMVL